MEHFVKTQDEGVANELRAQGFQELSKEDKYFVFINESKKVKTFDEKKVIYTDKICLQERKHNVQNNFDNGGLGEVL